MENKEFKNAKEQKKQKGEGKKKQKRDSTGHRSDDFLKSIRDRFTL